MFDRVLGILLVEEILHTDVDDPRGHVGALQELAYLDKAIRVITAQGAAQHAVDHLRARDDLLEVLLATAPAHGLLRGLLRVQVQFIDQFPDFIREYVAGRAHVLPSGMHGVGDTAGRLRFPDQQPQHVLFIAYAEPLVEDRIGIEDTHQHVPLGLGAAGNIHDQVVVGSDEACRILGTFDVTRHPVHPFRDPRQHGYSRPSTIQVSLLPPPWEEFTTSDPSTIATRVRPPGSPRRRGSAG
jgi:hypothetical protein